MESISKMDNYDKCIFGCGFIGAMTGAVLGSVNIYRSIIKRKQKKFYCDQSIVDDLLDSLLCTTLCSLFGLGIGVTIPVSLPIVFLSVGAVCKANRDCE
jgi:hypothetical protein